MALFSNAEKTRMPHGKHMVAKPMVKPCLGPWPIRVLGPWTGTRACDAGVLDNEHVQNASVARFQCSKRQRSIHLTVKMNATLAFWAMTMHHAHVLNTSNVQNARVVHCHCLERERDAHVSLIIEGPPIDFLQL